MVFNCPGLQELSVLVWTGCFITPGPLENLIQPYNQRNSLLHVGFAWINDCCIWILNCGNLCKKYKANSLSLWIHSFQSLVSVTKFKDNNSKNNKQTSKQTSIKLENRMQNLKSSTLIKKVIFYQCHSPWLLLLLPSPNNWKAFILTVENE